MLISSRTSVQKPMYLRMRDQPNSVSQTEWSAFDAANTAIWDIVTDGVTNSQSFKLTTLSTV